MLCVSTRGFLWIRPVHHLANAYLGAAAGPSATVHGVGCPENIGWLGSVRHLKCSSVFFLDKQMFFV